MISGRTADDCEPLPLPYIFARMGLHRHRKRKFRDAQDWFRIDEKLSRAAQAPPGIGRIIFRRRHHRCTAWPQPGESAAVVACPSAFPVFSWRVLVSHFHTSVNDDDPCAIDCHIGSRIQNRRVFLGLSQEELGVAMRLSVRQVQAAERGLRRVSIGELYHLAEVLDVPASYFLDSRWFTATILASRADIG